MGCGYTRLTCTVEVTCLNFKPANSSIYKNLVEVESNLLCIQIVLFHFIWTFWSSKHPLVLTCLDKWLLTVPELAKCLLVAVHCSDTAWHEGLSCYDLLYVVPFWQIRLVKCRGGWAWFIFSPVGDGLLELWAVYWKIRETIPRGEVRFRAGIVQVGISPSSYF